MIVGENGVVSRAQDSSVKTKTVSVQEAVDMALGAMTAEFMGDVWPSNTGAKIGDWATVGKFKEEVENNGYEVDISGISNINRALLKDNNELNIYKEGSSANITTFEISESLDGTSLTGILKETTISNNTEGNVENNSEGEDIPVVTTYTVSFYKENGDETIYATKTVNENGTVGSDMPIDPTKEGYTFEGWKVGDNSFDGSTVISENISVYGIWEQVLADAGRNVNTNNRTLSGSTDITKMTYKNPVIPQGFSAIDTTGAVWSYTDETNLDEVTGWNNGLVITDNLDSEGNSIGNEFVWVPCTIESVTSSSLIVQYSKNTNYPMSSGMSNIDNASDTTNKTGDNITYSAIPVTENTQIEKYGGFYVGRYEAGLSSAVNDEYPHANNNYDNVPVSKYGTKIWNYIDFTHSYVAAQKMIKNITIYGNNKSGLITGTQWDTIMKWFEKSGIGVGGTVGTQNWGTYKDISYSYSGSLTESYFIYDDSANGWSNGSFSHTALKSTQVVSSSLPAHFHASGLNTANGYKKNIADLGGNVRELTSEKCIYNSNSRCVCRGGLAFTGSSGSPASERSYVGESVGNYNLGFRVVLYIQ